MLFAEAEREWQSVPEWVRYLIGFGFDWPGKDPVTRRIALISMPCDSAAPGLVALGVLRRRLELEGANDLSEHFQRMASLAQLGDRDTILRPRNGRGRFVMDRGQDRDGALWVRQVPQSTGFRSSAASSASAGLQKWRITPENSTEWRFDGEAPVQVLHGDRIPHGHHYAELVNHGGTVLLANLTQSDSAICLAGRVVGESSTRSTMAGIRFQCEGNVVDLSQLLTIQDWSPGMVSRLSFFNSRTGQIDRATRHPQILVADGDTAFLKVVDKEEFQGADVIGVIHRTMDRDSLDDLGAKLVELEQWYVRDIAMPGSLPAPPRGISVLRLKRR